MPANTNPNANVGDRAVATALHGVIVRGEQNMLAETTVPSGAGARAALETFCHAFNTRSLDLMRQIWADDPLVQLDTPLVGLVRGSTDIAARYERGFSMPARVQSVFENIVAYMTPEMVVFTGRERGVYMPGSERDALSELPEIHTTCIFRFLAEQGGWRQVYHHVALDDADLLAQFQRAARGT
jgi:hypothetical protein